MLLSSKFTAILCLAISVRAYIWPSPKLDELESLLYDQHGHNQRPLLASFITPCSAFNFGNTTGRSNVADWIRAAYHDMATYNSEDGTGGLDGSIQFELDRAENAGDGLLNTVNHFALGVNRYAGLADLVAMGAAMAMEQCGGPKIPFRGGRVDAKVANNPGVPEPQQDLESHVASFARQGFNATEMISLVACGHSFGGVQRSAFPDIVPARQDPNADVQATFDTTTFDFDNNVATEYIYGTTTNPLAVGHNDTTNSDKRIFSSDNNTTMQAFVDSPDLFRATCADLFARMLDTVPQGVQLTEVIEPLSVKPQSVLLRYMGDGTLKLTGEVRFWDMIENPARSINVHWADRDGNSCTTCSAPIGHTSERVATAKSDGEVTTLWYTLNQTASNFVYLDETKGLSKLWFTIDEGNGNIRTEDQQGAGFRIQDVALLADSSCLNYTSQVATSQVDIAVRGDVAPSRVYLEIDFLNFGSKSTTTKTFDASPASVGNGSYSLWSVNLPFNSLDGSLRLANIAVDVDGDTFRTPNFQPFAITVPVCS